MHTIEIYKAGKFFLRLQSPNKFAVIKTAAEFLNVNAVWVNQCLGVGFARPLNGTLDFTLKYEVID
ncbi:hypothetical protein CMI37_35700 [Candidatus Pacearchaeota archaeon]|nr:hypothetical protein [Candidatus Pacearchaeota archaeon]|tara:strand:- start:311 stop:508 length:198 start_codon:yes stop_codon:yes gene_type:complete